jgi:hypothetical protein
MCALAHSSCREAFSSNNCGDSDQHCTNKAGKPWVSPHGCFLPFATAAEQSVWPAVTHLQGRTG